MQHLNSIHARSTAIRPCGLAVTSWIFFIDMKKRKKIIRVYKDIMVLQKQG